MINKKSGHRAGLSAAGRQLPAVDDEPRLGTRAAHAKQHFRDKLIEHGRYAGENGRDMPEIED